MKCIKIIKEFESDHITRVAGERLRNMIIRAAEKNEKITIDFSGVVIASTSFFDEGFAKLALHGWTGAKFRSRIIFKGLNENDRKVLSEMCKNRGLLIYEPLPVRAGKQKDLNSRGI